MVLLFNEETKETIEVFYGENAKEKLESTKRWYSVDTEFELNLGGADRKINVSYVCHPFWGQSETFKKLVFPQRGE